MPRTIRLEGAALAIARQIFEVWRAHNQRVHESLETTQKVSMGQHRELLKSLGLPLDLVGHMRLDFEYLDEHDMAFLKIPSEIDIAMAEKVQRARGRTSVAYLIESGRWQLEIELCKAAFAEAHPEMHKRARKLETMVKVERGIIRRRLSLKPTEQDRAKLEQIEAAMDEIGALRARNAKLQPVPREDPPPPEIAAKLELKRTDMAPGTKKNIRPWRVKNAKPLERMRENGNISGKQEKAADQIGAVFLWYGRKLRPTTGALLYKSAPSDIDETHWSNMARTEAWFWSLHNFAYVPWRDAERARVSILSGNGVRSVINRAELIIDVAVDGLAAGASAAKRGIYWPNFLALFTDGIDAYIALREKGNSDIEAEMERFKRATEASCTSS